MKREMSIRGRFSASDLSAVGAFGRWWSGACGHWLFAMDGMRAINTVLSIATSQFATGGVHLYRYPNVKASMLLLSPCLYNKCAA